MQWMQTLGPSQDGGAGDWESTQTKDHNMFLLQYVVKRLQISINKLELWAASVGLRFSVELCFPLKRNTSLNNMIYFKRV